MDDGKPKLSAWNYDDANKSEFNPGVPQQRSGNSVVAENMLRDTTARMKTKWLLRSSFLWALAIFIWFISHLIGFLIAAITCFNLARVVASGNNSPSKRPGIIILSVTGSIFLVLAFIF